MSKVSNPIGKLSECLFEQLCIMQGWPFALVGDKGETIDFLYKPEEVWLSVQVKTAQSKKGPGHGSVGISSSNRLKKNGYTLYNVDDIDAVAMVMIPLRTIWVVPVGLLGRDKRDFRKIKGSANVFNPIYTRHQFDLTSMAMKDVEEEEEEEYEDSPLFLGLHPGSNGD